jgi:hypothetical protein
MNGNWVKWENIRALSHLHTVDWSAVVSHFAPLWRNPCECGTRDLAIGFCSWLSDPLDNGFDLVVGVVAERSLEIGRGVPVRDEVRDVLTPLE